MNDPKLLHHKLDQLAAELSIIKQLLLKKDTISSDAQPLNVNQAAVFTGLAPSTIYKLVHYKKLQPLQRKKRGRLLFIKQTLLEFLYATNDQL